MANFSRIQEHKNFSPANVFQQAKTCLQPQRKEDDEIRVSAADLFVLHPWTCVVGLGAAKKIITDFGFPTEA